MPYSSIKKSITFIFALVSSFALMANVVDYGIEHNIYSFEDGVQGFRSIKKSKLSISDEHAKLGRQSLKWSYNADGACISLKTNIDYLPINPNPKETSVSSFVFWLYSPSKIDGNLRFTFFKNGKEQCWFDYKLGFQGWRGAWVAFERDMQGRPAENMDELRISLHLNEASHKIGSRDRNGLHKECVRKANKSVLYFDGIIPCSFQDVRHHTPDWQAEFINKETTSHWLLLNKSWKKVLDIPSEEMLTKAQVQELELIRNRFIELICSGKKALSINKVREIESCYNISFNKDGSIKGKPIYFTRYGETFLNLGIKDASSSFNKNGQLLKSFNDKMLSIAVSYLLEKDEAVKKEIADIYIRLTRHLLDQGFAAGSAQGTLHHLGYSMRNFYTAPIIMSDVLAAHGLREEVQQAMEWFSGVGEIKTAPKEKGIDIDAFNTSLMGRMASVLMLENSPYKYAYMKAMSRWIDNGFKITEGTSACFKSDGTVVHHRKAYPAYAIGGFTGACNAVWMFSGTSLKISQESHQILKKALLEMRFYCNLQSFPLAMSGRHPDGEGALIPEHYSRLALAGSPDMQQKVDKELAQAYLRLVQDAANNGIADKKINKDIQFFTSLGYTAEKTPNGTHVYPYNCSMSHRWQNALVTFAGHSRYFWSAEIYNKANHYGRYLTHGSMQIMANPTDSPSAFGSGFQVAGWDWCHIPGTTAAEIPMGQMKANVLNVDKYSGYEEMLLSDETFAGGVSHRDSAGVYAMILHEHDKYNGSLRARKSYFVVENRIVALGSGLENQLENSPLHTTLFQNSLSMEEFESGAPRIYKEIAYCGAKEIINGKANCKTVGRVVLKDKFGNLYIVSSPDSVVFNSSLQKSFHEETDEETEGYFEKAYIYHGNSVKDGSYEYLVVLSPPSNKSTYTETDKPTAIQEDYYKTNAAENRLGKSEELNKTALPYEVIRCDKKAHIVRDNIKNITAIVAFEACGEDDLTSKNLPISELGLASINALAIGDALVKKTSPGLIMYSPNGNGEIVMSVANPDMAFYSGESDDVYKDGKRVERSVYSRTWIDNPSKETQVEFELKGNWKIKSIKNNSTKIDIDSTILCLNKDGKTYICIKTREGATVEFTLNK